MRSNYADELENFVNNPELTETIQKQGQVLLALLQSTPETSRVICHIAILQAAEQTLRSFLPHVHQKLYQGSLSKIL